MAHPATCHWTQEPGQLRFPPQSAKAHRARAETGLGARSSSPHQNPLGRLIGGGLEWALGTCSRPASRIWSHCGRQDNADGLERISQPICLSLQVVAAGMGSSGTGSCKSHAAARTPSQHLPACWHIGAQAVGIRGKADFIWGFTSFRGSRLVWQTRLFPSG